MCVSFAQKLASKMGDKLESTAKEQKKGIKSKDDYFKKYKRDVIEVTQDQMIEVDFPKTKKRYIITLDSFNASIEEAYFWMYNFMKIDLSFFKIDKILDLFSASESSSFFGSMQQRLGIQQDKVASYLATVGKLVKDLFQMVRELRFIDERLEYYEASYSDIVSVYEPAEITLKGLYIDMVEGATKNPASVYGLAKDLQFTTLPDLFFSITARDSKDIGKKVDSLDFNKPLKNVLKRKLFTFLKWKEETHKELKSRRQFMLKYLRQHFAIIKMYMSWIKPYLRNIKRITMDASRNETPDLISAFESSTVEIEILGQSLPQGNKDYKSCVLLHFYYRTMPQMNYTTQDYQHRGPLHVGEITITWRAYAWNDEDIANFKRMRMMEEFELIGTIDESLKAAMDALGDTFFDYLEEAGESVDRAEEETSNKTNKPSQTAAEPFVSLFGGFKDIFHAFVPEKEKKNKVSQKVVFRINKEKGSAMGGAKAKSWLLYKAFKKSHRCLAW